jgi:heme-degrading monooxygenase HmoA
MAERGAPSTHPSRPAIPIVSVTRFRLRAIRYWPLFLIHANRAIAQVRAADGFLTGALQRDAQHALWTMTMWRDVSALEAYVASRAHRNAMPHLADWGLEAAAVRWHREDPSLPEWAEAGRRLRDDGRTSHLLDPGPDHQERRFPDPSPHHSMRL